MTWFRLALRCAIGILLCFGISGCLPSGDSQLDEQKEPHFLTGRNLVSQMDFKGAIASFEKALEVNPRSGSAHFELGCLYEKDNDPAAAIYHYERFLKLRPNSSEAELARGHILTCKMDLAKTVSSLGPVPPSTQREMERVLLENQDLKAQLARWEAAYANHTQPPTTTNTPAPAQNSTRPTAEPVATNRGVTAQSETAAATNRSTRPASVRTHIVKAGENPAAIARKYGISTSALLAANPQAKPTHLQIGQVLNLPAP